MTKSQTALLAHQLRTSLTIIQNDLWLATQDQNLIPTRRWQPLRQALITTRRLITLTNHILTAQSAPSQTNFLHPKLFHLKRLIMEILTQLQPLMMNRGLSYQINQTDIDRVWADRDQIRQVYLNLLDNAIKFAPSGSQIQIDLSQSIGMTTIVISNQTQSSLRSQPGHGWGLAICQQIINLSGGKIWLLNQSSSTFRIAVSLPASR